MKRKKVLLTLVGIILIWSFYGYLIRTISYLEKSNLKIERELRELEKERSKRIYEYDLLMDLSKIEQEMNKQKNIVISEKINFFKIEDRSF